MRIPPNLKFFLGLLLGLGLITLGVLYLPKLIPNIGQIMISIMLIGMALLFLLVLIKPFFTFLYARADGVFAVYIDKGGMGFHVFAYHQNSGGEAAFGTRDIQQYYITFDKGKVYYKCIFSHSMEPDSGRLGWGGFSSFETNVLGSPKLEKSMQRLSAKSGKSLELGKRIEPLGDDHFLFEKGDKKVELQKFNTLTDEGIKVSCMNRQTGAPLWDKKI